MGADMTRTLASEVCGRTGTAVGFFGLTVLVLHFFLGPVSATAPVDFDEWIQGLGLVLALAAIGLGVTGFLRRERFRASGAALALGTAGVCFQLAIMVFGALVFVAIIATIIHTHFM